MPHEVEWETDNGLYQNQSSICVGDINGNNNIAMPSCQVPEMLYKIVFCNNHKMAISVVGGEGEEIRHFYRIVWVCLG